MHILEMDKVRSNAYIAFMLTRRNVLSFMTPRKTGTESPSLERKCRRAFSEMVRNS